MPSGPCSDASACNGNGKCIKVNCEKTCKCKPGFYGKWCEKGKFQNKQGMYCNTKKRHVCLLHWYIKLKFD